MTTLHMLTIRRTAALSKLMTLQKRVERMPSPAASVLASALSELGDALEELAVATEQLQSYVEELAETRHSLVAVRSQWEEYADAVPVASIWTSVEGEIEQANDAAAGLLNVSAKRLVGRPLMLFFADRAKFTEALTALNQGLTTVIDTDIVVRPRERRHRTVRLTGRHLQNDVRRCWFLAPPVAIDAADPARD